MSLSREEKMARHRIACRKYYAKNKTKELERLRRYRLENPDKRKATVGKYYRNNKAKHREGVYKWRAKNKEKVLEINRNSWEANKGKWLPLNKEWNKKNPGKKNAYAAAYRARRNKAIPPWVNKKDFVEIYQLAKSLGQVVDHIVPLKGKNVCGLHVPWNLQIISQSENSKKYNKIDHLAS